MNESPRERAIRQAAESLDATPDLLPWIPFLLADFESLGGDVPEALEVLDHARLRPAEALDLGCGKGALAVALAQRGWRVRGADLVEPFIDDANRRAAQAGVADRCAFTCDDLCAVARATPDESVDLLLLMAVGRPFGSLRRTLDACRRIVRPGGHLLFDDAVLNDGALSTPGLEPCLPLGPTIAELARAFGAVISTTIPTLDARRARHAHELSMIRSRAARLAADRPDAAPAAAAFVARQEAAYRDLEGPLLPVLFLVRRR